nr:CDP-glycerol glycerophosphotransferase family protein [Eubacterium sp.]
YLDGKFIRYYVRRIAKYYTDSGKKTDFEELDVLAKKCLEQVGQEALKRSMKYSQRLVKYSKTHKPEEIAVKVRHHSSRQRFVSLIAHPKKIKRYLYRKVFLKRPIKKNRVMLECFFGRNYSDSPKYIFEYLAKNYGDKYEFVWNVAGGKKIKYPYKSKVVTRFSLRYYYYLATSNYFVFNVRQPNWFVKRKGMKFLETWHGTPLKRLAFDQEEVASASITYKKNTYLASRDWDYLVAPNKFSSDIFRSCFMFDNHMLETGYPRNDILYTKGEERDRLVEEIKAEFNLPRDKKVILYAPTWRDDEFYGIGQYKFTLALDLDRMQKEFGDEYVILFRTHYYVVDAVDLEPYKGFVYNAVKYNDIARLYLISDLLITDYSSVFFDFANLRRPMIFFMYDLEKYRGTLRGFYFDAEEEVPGPIVQTNDQLVEAIKNAEKLSQTYGEKYDAFYQKYCGWEDGTSTEKVVKEVFLTDK